MTARTIHPTPRGAAHLRAPVVPRARFRPGLHRDNPAPGQGRTPKLAPALALTAVLTAVSGAPGAATAQVQAPATAVVAPADGVATTNTPDRRIEVRGFNVTGATLLDADTVQAVLAPFRGQRTLSDLRRAAQALQARYVDAGFGAVVAYLPSQAIEDGVIGITVLEGRIAEVAVEGHRRSSAAQIRASLPTLREGETPRVRRIDGELQMANENPGRQVGVLLGPGKQPGEVRATVQVQESDPQRWQLNLDNSGNQRTGRYRASLGWQHADLTGHDDVVNVQVQTSPTASDAVAVLSGGYRYPLPGWLSALDVFAAYNDVDGGTSTTPAGDLNFAGRGRVAGARWTRYLPRLGEFDQRLMVSLEQRAYLNQCSITGLPAGACGAAGESVTVHPLTIEWATQRGGDWSAGGNVSLSYNAGLGGRYGDAAQFEAVRPGAPKHYAVLRGGGSVTLPVLEDWSFTARANGQWAMQPLVPGEQFGLGGSFTVRGYEEREITGDSGLLAGVELGAPRLDFGRTTLPMTLQLLAFGDAGTARNRNLAACNGTQLRCTLVSAGLGARLGVGAHVQTRLYVATALEDGANTARGDWRAHFSLNASF